MSNRLSVWSSTLYTICLRVLKTLNGVHTTAMFFTLLCSLCFYTKVIIIGRHFIMDGSSAVEFWYHQCCTAVHSCRCISMSGSSGLYGQLSNWSQQHSLGNSQVYFLPHIDKLTYSCQLVLKNIRRIHLIPSHRGNKVLFNTLVNLRIDYPILLLSFYKLLF